MHYGRGDDVVRAVDGLDLTVDPGTVTAILGPNGAGKTTTIETCEGFRRPQSGRVRVLGLDPVADAEALRPRVGVMLQSGGAWLGVRAGEMLRHMASLYANPLPADALVAAASRAAAASMSRKSDGSGMKPRRVGVRWRSISSRATPRASKSWVTRSSGARLSPPISALVRRQCHGWPRIERVMPSAASVMPALRR